MASLVAVAQIRGEAVARIEAVQARLKTALDVDPVELPTQGRDPMLVVARQFSGLADYLEAVADAVEGKSQGKKAAAKDDAQDAPKGKKAK